MLKQFIIKILTVINFAEGIIHLVVSCISFWGIYDTNNWDWRVVTAPTTDLFLGLASLITSYVLKDFIICKHKSDGE